MLLNKHKRANSRKNSAKEGICDLEDQTEEISHKKELLIKIQMKR